MQLEAHHVGIIVSDLARSKSFYEALGFELATERDDGTQTICFLELGEFKLELFAYREMPPTVACEGRVIGFRHLALRTDDMDAAANELQRPASSTRARCRTSYQVSHDSCSSAIPMASRIEK